MKKKYVSPVVYTENMRTNTVLSSCVTNITGPIPYLTYDDGSVDTIFGITYICDYDYTSMDSLEILDTCYNTPVDATMIFNS